MANMMAARFQMLDMCIRKVIFSTKMREMAISFHVLVDGLAYIGFVNMPRCHIGLFFFGCLNSLFPVNLKIFLIFL